MDGVKRFKICLQLWDFDYLVKYIFSYMAVEPIDKLLEMAPDVVKVESEVVFQGPKLETCSTKKSCQHWRHARKGSLGTSVAYSRK